MSKTAFLFPGQGAQYVEMGKDFYNAFAIAKETFQEASDLLSRNLTDLIFKEGEALSETKNSQIAIFVVSSAILRVVRLEFPDLAAVSCAGLSLGEYTALCAAEKVAFADAVRMVSLRGQYMQEACQNARGAMRVVLGLGVEEVRAHLPADMWIANLNCPGQVVIAGLESAMPACEEALKAQGARRILPLDVSGAFHTPLMQPAQEKLTPYLEQLKLHMGTADIVMNVTGAVAHSEEEIRKNLIAQVVSTTEWEKGIRTIEKQKPSLYIEMGPGKTLAGMNKKIGVQAPTLSIEKVVDLEALDGALHR